MRSLVKTQCVFWILLFLISGCASHPKNVPATIEIGVSMLDLPPIPRPVYEKMLDEPLTTKANQETFLNNVTKLKDWAEKLFIKYEAIRNQNDKIKALQESQK